MKKLDKPTLVLQAIHSQTGNQSNISFEQNGCIWTVLSRAHIASLVKCSIKTVGRALTNLTDAKLLFIKPYYSPSKTFPTNAYSICPTAIERLKNLMTKKTKIKGYVKRGSIFKNVPRETTKNKKTTPNRLSKPCLSETNFKKCPLSIYKDYKSNKSNKSNFQNKFLSQEDNKEVPLVAKLYDQCKLTLGEHRVPYLNAGVARFLHAAYKKLGSCEQAFRKFLEDTLKRKWLTSQKWFNLCWLLKFKNMDKILNQQLLDFDAKVTEIVTIGTELKDKALKRLSEIGSYFFKNNQEYPRWATPEEINSHQEMLATGNMPILIANRLKHKDIAICKDDKAPKTTTYPQKLWITNDFTEKTNYVINC